MAHSIYISNARKLLQSPESLDISLWPKSGKIQHWNFIISFRNVLYKGARCIKFLTVTKSDNYLIYIEINDMEVFLKEKLFVSLQRYIKT